jgi:hypothetical protein
MILTLDIAHPPLRSDAAEIVLDESLRKAKNFSLYRVLKIVHGYGSGGKGGTLKTVVRNWVYKNQSNIKYAIDGEQISPFNPLVQEMCIACNLQLSKDFGIPNKGVTIIWVK